MIHTRLQLYAGHLQWIISWQKKASDEHEHELYVNRLSSGVMLINCDHSIL